MKYNKIPHILVIICTFFFTNNANAQVTIGGGTPPSSFSAIQVEGKGGVRIPRMDLTGRTTLTNSWDAAAKLKAEGLVIYNTSYDQMEFFDGTNWVSIKGVQITASNAITLSGNSLKLGGAEERNTSINLQDYKFNTKNTSGFPLNMGTSVSVNEDVVNITPGSTFSVNGSRMTINNRNITMNPSLFSANGGLLSASSSEIGISGSNALKYVDGNQQSGYLLVSDASGNASWDGVRPFGTVVRGRVVAGNPVSGQMVNTTAADSIKLYELDKKGDTTGAGRIVSTTLRLNKGKWMIFGKLTARANSNLSTNAMYAWLVLQRRNGTSGSFTDVFRTGRLPLSTGGNSYCTPNFVYTVELTGTAEFCIYGASSSLLYSTTERGGGYFYAVRIDS